MSPLRERSFTFSNPASLRALDAGDVGQEVWVEDMSDLDPFQDYNFNTDYSIDLIWIACVVHGRLYIVNVSAMIIGDHAYVDADEYMEALC